jgi:tetratricopeptide (TPR) repeat protein
MILHPIADYPIPVLLKKILAYGLSGVLHIKGEGFDKDLYFTEGVLVYAKSSKMDERIGVILHLTGKINEKQYDNISGLLHGSDRQAAEILIQNHFASREDVRSAMLYLIRRIALSTFLLEKGSWQFESEAAVSEKIDLHTVHLPAIIAEGARKIRNIAYFKDKIYFHSPVTTGIPDLLYPLLTDEEIYFYKELEKCVHLSNGEIISQLNLLPGFYWEKIIVFLMLDVVEFEEHTMAYDRAARIKKLVEINEKLKSGDLDNYGILEVKKTASTEKIEESYRQKKQMYHPDRFGSAAASEIKQIARFVSSGIEDAYKTLINKEKTPSQKDKKQSKEEPHFKANSLFEKAQSLYSKNEYHDAVQLLKMAVKLDSTRGKYFYLLGVCQTELFYFFGDAERNLKKAIELDPWNADPVYALGMLFRKQKKLGLSEKCFRRALEVDKSRGDAGKAIAELHKQRGAGKKGSFFSIFKDKQH